MPGKSYLLKHFLYYILGRKACVAYEFITIIRKLFINSLLLFITMIMCGSCHIFNSWNKSHCTLAIKQELKGTLASNIKLVSEFWMPMAHKWFGQTCSLDFTDKVYVEYLL